MIISVDGPVVVVAEKVERSVAVTVGYFAILLGMMLDVLKVTDS